MSNTPKLRFPEFSGPWEIFKLDEYLVEYNEKSTITNQFPILTSARSGLYLQDEYFKRQVTTNDNRGYNIIPYGYITYRSRSDDSTIKFNENTIIEKGIVSYFYPVFTFSEGINNYFAVAFMNTKLIKMISKMVVGTSQLVLSLNKLRQFEITAPTVVEQTKIADFLSLIDKRVAKQDEIVVALELYKKGLMQKIFSRELRFKDDDGNDYPEWDKCTLHDIGTISSGVGFSETHQGQKGLEISVYKVSDMNIPSNSKYMVEANNYVSKETCKAMNAKCINRAAIIFAKVGAAIFLERKKITTKPFLVDNNMMYLMPHDVSNIEFAYYLMSSIRLSKYAQVGALPSYNASDIGIIKIELPTLTEQTKIANFLSLFDRKIEKEKKKLDALREQKKALLQQMFV